MKWKCEFHLPLAKFYYVRSDSFIATAPLKSGEKIYSNGGGIEHVSTNQVKALLKRETDGCKGKFEDINKAPSRDKHHPSFKRNLFITLVNIVLIINQ